MGPAHRQVMAPDVVPGGPRPGDVVRNPLVHGRETVESIIVAFTLALLFRAFEAEAFVIPTGSMAPTLMGRHKDLVCDSCGRDFRVGCSAEEDDQSQSLRTEQSRLERELADLERVVADGSSSPQERESARRRIELLQSEGGPLAQIRTRLAGKMVPAAKCPNCGRVMGLLETAGERMRYDARYPSYNGDRILVNKFIYDFAEPQRWDVVVFKYPEDAKTNYIKRLVGLPGETVSLVGGDVWTNREGEPPRIARKPPEKLLAMLQCVFDGRYHSARLQDAGWPPCWSDWSSPRREAAVRWTTDDGGRSFAVAAEGDASATLRYRHYLPTAEDWAAVRAGTSFDAAAVKPTLVDDFQPYNAIATRPHWVGDLAIDMRLESRGPAGTVTIDLVEAGKAHRCTFDLAVGDVAMAIAGDESGVVPRARTNVRGVGSWRVLLANVDDELSLFVDGRKVDFDHPTVWERSIESAEANQPYDGLIEPGMKQSGDLAPVGVTASGASVRVADLRVLRDVFYIGALDIGARPGELIERDRLAFDLGADQFFVLGDNSAASKDSRLWVEGHHVDRHLLAGKALLIFWPHAWGIPLKIGGWQMRLPCWPNFARMGFVR
jgi:signal peptidase I